MYNAVLKERFIDDYAKKQSVRDACVAVFDKIAGIEELRGTDFCRMNEDDAGLIIDAVSGVRTDNGRVHILESYIRWCAANQISGTLEWFLTADKRSANKVRGRMVSGPIHLQNCLNEVFDAEDERTIDNIYRCFCWFAFMGIPQNDAILITSDEVDFADMVIRHKLQSYEIYRPSIPAVRNCAEMTKLCYQRSDTGRVYYRTRFEGNELLRGQRGVMSLRSIRSLVVARKRQYASRDEFKCDFSYGTLWLSGVFYRMYESERAGIAPDFYPLAAMQMDGKIYSEKSGHSAKTRQTEIVGYYKKDYEYWKETFG